MTPITILVAVAVGLVVVRQFQARELRTGPLVAIPVILLGLGGPAFAAHAPSTITGILLFAASLAVSAALGVARGRSERVWHTANGAPWRQATSRTALLWVASVAARVITLAVARALGDHSAQTTQLELLLGVSFAAQHLVLANRGRLLGRPAVAPAKA